MTDNDGDTGSYAVTAKVEEEESIPAFEFAFLIIAIAIILIKRRNKK